MRRRNKRRLIAHLLEVASIAMCMAIITHTWRHYPEVNATAVAAATGLAIVTYGLALSFRIAVKRTDKRASTVQRRYKHTIIGPPKV